MNSYRIIIFLLVMMTIPPVEAADHINWIYFKDKGIGPLPNVPHEIISVRSISRREKILPPNRLVDERDAPLCEHYIESIQRMGVRIRHRSRWLNAVSVFMDDIPDSSIRSLPFVQDIRSVRSYQRVPLLPERVYYSPGGVTDDTYGLSFNQISQIGVDKLHSLGYSGTGVLICMIDTGFHKDHISLKNSHVIAERDFVFNDNDTQRDPDNPEDFSDSHGTATWSAAAAYDPGELIGPAFGASFILAKTEDLRYEEPIEEDNWIAAVEWADSIGADIISSSLAYTLFDDGSGYSFDDLDGNTAATTIVADRAAELGIAVIVAAGNYRTTAWGHIGTPADGDSVISVGAVDASGAIASFSSPGPTADGRIKPEVCAQGVSTYCATNASFGYTYKNGTSLSTPLVAGAAALLLETHPSWTGQDIRTAFLNSASQSDYADNDYGWGIIDAFRASGIEALFLEMTSISFDDDSLDGSRGNANGYVEAGETIELTVSFQNTGSIYGGSLSGTLSSNDDRIFISEPHTSLTIGEPGDSAGILTPFICEVESDIHGTVDIPLLITIVRELSDTVYVSELTLPIRDIVRVAGIVLNIENSEPVTEAVVSVIEHGMGYVSDETETDSNGNFELWLDPDTYSLFASKEGYASTDRVLWTEENGETTLFLAQPFISAQPGSLLIATVPDTSFSMPLEVVNESNWPVTVSFQLKSHDPAFTNPTVGPMALRYDMYEGFTPDIAGLYGRNTSSSFDFIISFYHSIELDGSYRLRIGIDADDNDGNGSPVAGLYADYLIEVTTNGMLYEFLSSSWHFQSFVSIENSDSSIIISVPKNALEQHSAVLGLAMEVEIVETPEKHGDSVPDNPGSYPVSWNLERPNWALPDSAFYEYAPGAGANQWIHISTYNTPPGSYCAELILQGTIVEEQRFPVILVLDGEIPVAPDELTVMSTYPNPFLNFIDVMISIPKGDKLHARMIDISGRTVQTFDPLECQPGIQWHRFDINNSVSSGVYMICMTTQRDRVMTGPIIRTRYASSP